MNLGLLYRHYKGGLYMPIAMAERHTHNGDIDVVYISFTYMKYCTRPLRRDSRNEDCWTDRVIWPDNEVRARFELEQPTLAKLFEKEKSDG